MYCSVTIAVEAVHLTGNGGANPIAASKAFRAAESITSGADIFDGGAATPAPTRFSAGLALTAADFLIV